MDRPSARNGEIRTGGDAGMPRAPLTGVVAGLVGLFFGAAGLALAAWVATVELDTPKGFEAAMWALRRADVELPWDPVVAANYAINHTLPVAIVAAVALFLAALYLRQARIAFRPRNVSNDGKGELHVAALEPRVGRPFDGTIRLRDAPVPGEEFIVKLTSIGPNRAPEFEMEQKARARPGAHGANLPFRFDVPFSARASSRSHRWRLEFSRADRKYLGRSAFDVHLGPPNESERRVADLPPTQSHVPAPVATVSSVPAHGSTAELPMKSPAAAQANGYASHIEKLYGALGGKLTERQREQLRGRLSGREAEALKQQLEGLRKLQPGHVKMFKYAAIGLFVVFFVLPFVFSVLGMILAAIFSR